MASLFKRKPEEVLGATLIGADPEFNPAEVLTVLYETKPEIIAEILPPPLQPYKKPYVIISYNNFKDTSFEYGMHGPGYRSTQLLIPAVFDGIVGNFVLSQICNSDMCTVQGREKYGYPKKGGIVEHRCDQDRFVGFSARHGIPFCIVDTDLTQAPNDPDFLKELAEATTSDPNRPSWGVNWTFKYSLGHNSDVFKDDPELVKGWKNKEEVLAPAQAGFAKVTLIPSVDDPWFELEPVRVLGGVVSRVNSHMKCAAPDGLMEYFPVNKDEYLPYAFYGWDRNFK